MVPEGSFKTLVMHGSLRNDKYLAVDLTDDYVLGKVEGCVDVALLDVDSDLVCGLKKVNVLP